MVETGLLSGEGLEMPSVAHPDGPGCAPAPPRPRGLEDSRFSRTLRKLAADQMMGGDGVVLPFAIFEIRYSPGSTPVPPGPAALWDSDSLGLSVLEQQTRKRALDQEAKGPFPDLLSIAKDGRSKINVSTICSGTGAPIFALKTLATELFAILPILLAFPPAEKLEMFNKVRPPETVIGADGYKTVGGAPDTRLTTAL
ncbi:hypothetical protein LQW54_007180 [Pestalotiopsis sp. IQ-011]